MGALLPAPLGLSRHSFWVPKARPGGPRVEDPQAHLNPTLLQRPVWLACPRHLPMNSISLSSLKTTEL